MLIRTLESILLSINNDCLLYTKRTTYIVISSNTLIFSLTNLFVDERKFEKCKIFFLHFPIFSYSSLLIKCST